MSQQLVPVHQWRRLPPVLYGASAFLLAVLVAAGWVAFGAGTYTTLAFGVGALVVAMFTGFIAMVVSGEKHGHGARPIGPRLTHWLRGRFETGDGEMPSRDAMIQVLLPSSAAALGFVAIALVGAFVL